MNFAGYLRREVRRKLKNRKLTVRAAGLVFAGIASIGIAYGALRAQNRAGLHSILDEIAAGRKVSPRVSLPPQVGFFDGATALYITPEVGSTRMLRQPSLPPRNRSLQGSTPISFLKTSECFLAPRRWMTSSCSPILPKETSYPPHRILRVLLTRTRITHRYGKLTWSPGLPDTRAAC